ncbi:MAG: cupin domain-containing protein [Gammaproteobacteria bacterium]|nr:cupin domain-containing protein [Gammaproteobacteria bacterium]MDH5592159.1 cupin domain-containing protein [Gammaproteobacteria bacterium]
MPEIIIEKNPSEERLKELGVASWETWDCPVSEFRLDFDETEKAYILEGEIVVTPDGGEPVRIVPGDYVEFPEGLTSMWQVVKTLRKHYSYD